MGFKQLVAVSLSSLLALFIRTYQFLTSLIFTVSSPFQLLSATNRRIYKSWTNLNGERGTAACECIHIVANSSLSLMLAFGVFHYH
jgi:hypothetical protein